MFDVIKKNTKAVFVLGTLFAAQAAMAAGGLEAATTQLKSIAETIRIVVGIVATIALLWECAQGFMGRKTWGDVFGTCLWIFGAGAAFFLATWIFEAGKSTSF